MQGEWTAEKAGGKLRAKGKQNPRWCSNPQYFLNLEKPTHLKVSYPSTPLTLNKIILRKHQKKTVRNINPRISICRFF